MPSADIRSHPRLLLFSQQINSNLQCLTQKPLNPICVDFNHPPEFFRKAFNRFRFQLLTTLSLLLGVFSSSAQSLWPSYSAEKCSGTGSKLKYLSGDALIDSPHCVGPTNLPYPSSTINRAFNGGSSRKGRQSHMPTTLDPIVMQSTLLNAYREVNEDQPSTRHGEFVNHRKIPLWSR